MNHTHASRSPQHYYMDSTSSYNMGTLSYDAVNERLSFRGETRTADTKGYFHAIVLYGDVSNACTDRTAAG